MGIVQRRIIPRFWRPKSQAYYQFSAVYLRSMADLYYDSDADLSALKNKTIATLGYGAQGRAQALNLRDSGLQVIVGARPGRSMDRAAEDGFDRYSIAEATERADLLSMLINDEYQRELYNESIFPHLQPGKTLLFAHGFNIAFGQISPPSYTDVIMVAPVGVGELVRRLYLQGSGAPCLIAVHHDYSGSAKTTALAYAKAIGGTRAGVIETTFKEECETDLFGEQAVIVGGLTALLTAGYETLTEAGYQPELAYFECVHQLKLIVDLIYERGISGMRQAISDTALYGDLTRGPRIVNDETKARMRELLKEIQDGRFARDWLQENVVGRPVFSALLKQGEEHPMEDVGKNLRRMATEGAKPDS